MLILLIMLKKSSEFAICEKIIKISFYPTMM